MGYLTGAFCILCTVAIINGGKPFKISQYPEILQNSNYLQSDVMTDDGSSVYIDDESDEKVVATVASSRAPNDMFLALGSNEWRQQKKFNKQNMKNDKRTYVQDMQQVIQEQHPLTASCDVCKTQFKLFDLGHLHFPRFIVRAVCQGNSRHCKYGTKCKEVPYKIRVLTHRNTTDAIGDADLPEILNNDYKFKTITIAVSCQCAD